MHLYRNEIQAIDDLQKHIPFIQVGKMTYDEIANLIDNINVCKGIDVLGEDLFLELASLRKRIRANHKKSA